MTMHQTVRKSSVAYNSATSMNIHTCITPKMQIYKLLGVIHQVNVKDRGMWRRLWWWFGRAVIDSQRGGTTSPLIIFNWNHPTNLLQWIGY